MPIDPIPKSLYPFVPQALGVPNLLRQGAQLIDTVTLGYLGAGDALSQVIGSPPIQWGVFDAKGGPVADYDSVSAIEYQNESKISDYPLEQGKFGTYNKVENPFDVTVTLTRGGSDDERASFIADIENLRASRDTFIVVTPECTYTNLNFVSVRMQRTSREGVGLVTVQLNGREVRNTANVAGSTPKDISGSESREQGLIQSIDDDGIDTTGVV